MKKYDLVVYVGRFQPLHNAHLNIINRAVSLAERVLVIVGSAHQPRTHKNPFTFKEREEMIRGATTHLHNVIIEPNIDTIYDDDAWICRTQEIVNKWAGGPDKKVAIIGFSKDADTARYLKMFPQWELIDVPHEHVLSATDIRDLYFSANHDIRYLQGVVPESTLKFLTFFDQNIFDAILAEKTYIEAYRKKKEVYEYPIIAVTVDNVVIQSGHILLIKRRAIPGKGLWALPGGYFDAVKDRTPIDGMLRELREETKIDLPDKVLRGSLVEQKEFCAPGRSLLGRSITFAGHFRLNDGEWNLPKVKGADDAIKARWVPLVDLKRELLFDDHADIIHYFLPSVRF